MKPGTIYTETTTRDGRKAILRAPKYEDNEDLRQLINELVEEEALIGSDTMVTEKRQVERHTGLMNRIEQDRGCALVAEIDGKAVGFTMADFRGGRLRHVASMGISIRKAYRGQGLGGKMINELEKQTRRFGIEIMVLEVYATNPSISLYERHGYETYGVLSNGIKYRGEYVDCVSMYKRLE